MQSGWLVDWGFFLSLLSFSGSKELGIFLREKKMVWELYSTSEAVFWIQFWAKPKQVLQRALNPKRS
jgi:hypothetical protein